MSPEELCDLASNFVLDLDLCAYGKIIVFANSIVLRLEWLANSCPCHRHVAETIRSSGLWFRTRRKRIHYFHYSSIGADCPIRGCVAPEVGAGDIMEASECFKQTASSEVLLIVADVRLEARIKIIRDFECGHQHLHF